jgi:hypothetical protein
MFALEGSEFKKKRQFGHIYVGGTNEFDILRKLRTEQNCFVVGSCNAHALSRSIWLNLQAFPEVFKSSAHSVNMDAEILRRSDDPNKTQVATSFCFSTPDLDYETEGTYHTYNALTAFRTIGTGIGKLNVYSRAAKLSDPFMHCVLWRTTLPGIVKDAKARILKAAEEDMYCATTLYRQANTVYMESHEMQPNSSYWFASDRCYHHLILSVPTIKVRYNQESKTTILEYGYFVPQDSNTILSNIAMILMARDPLNFRVPDYEDLIRPLLSRKRI